MKRRALLIGINRYEDAGISRLLCAEKDALALDFFLRDRCGFDTTSLINDLATKRRITEAVRHLCAELAPGDVFLFYFAGHGHEDHQTNQQLLLPWDVRLQDIRDNLQPDIVPLRGIETASAYCGASRFFVLDACRMPLLAGSRDVDARMRDVVAADATQMVDRDCRGNPPLVVLHSCSPNQRAYEVEGMGRGVFSKAFEEVVRPYVEAGREWSLPGRGLEELSAWTMRLLRQHQRGGRQDPMIWSNRGRVVLVEGRAGPPPPGPELPPASAVAAPAAQKPASPEPVAPLAGAEALRLPIPPPVSASQKAVSAEARKPTASGAEILAIPPLITRPPRPGNTTRPATAPAPKVSGEAAESESNSPRARPEDGGISPRVPWVLRLVVLCALTAWFFAGPVAWRGPLSRPSMVPVVVVVGVIVVLIIKRSRLR